MSKEEVPPLWAHQEKAIELALRQRDFALLMQMGTGKTRTLLEILRRRYNQNKRVAKTIIFAPPIVLPNWRAEWLKYTNIPPSDVLVLYGPGKVRLKLIENHGARILITNYESLLMGPVFKAMKEWAPEILVADESHRLKDSKAKRTKLACELARQPSVKHRYILSGTPVLNSLLDLFSQYLFMDLGATFSDNFFGFRARYFYDKNAGMPRDRYFPDFRVRPGAMEQVQAELDRTSFKITKDECLTLPPLVKQQRVFEMSEDQRKSYDEMKKDFITYVHDAACVATMALTKALRLQQIASGYMPVQGEGTGLKLHAFKENPRAEALKELLETITPHSKVLVWATFRQNYADIRAVCEELKLAYVEVHGDVSAKEQREAVDNFNTDPTIKVFIGNPGSGGLGINLVVASYSIFYSRDFSLEHDLQAEARNHRGGSEIHARITRYDLIAKDSIDELIATQLAAKSHLSRTVLEFIKDNLK